MTITIAIRIVVGLLVFQVVATQQRQLRRHASATNEGEAFAALENEVKEQATQLFRRDLLQSPYFFPLACNRNLLRVSCTKTWTAEFGTSAAFDDQITIPCGECIVMNFDGPILELKGGLDIQGKLVINQPLSRLETPYVIIQGEFVIESRQKATDKPFVTVAITEGKRNTVFLPADTNVNACGGYACDAGKATIVVAGGNLDITGSADLHAPAWVFLQDVYEQTEFAPIGIVADSETDLVKGTPAEVKVTSKESAEATTLNKESLNIPVKKEDRDSFDDEESISLPTTKQAAPSLSYRHRNDRDSFDSNEKEGQRRRISHLVSACSATLLDEDFFSCFGSNYHLCYNHIYGASHPEVVRAMGPLAPRPIIPTFDIFPIKHCLTSDRTYVFEMKFRILQVGDISQSRIRCNMSEETGCITIMLRWDNTLGDSFARPLYMEFPINAIQMDEWFTINEQISFSEEEIDIDNPHMVLRIEGGLRQSEVIEVSELRLRDEMAPMQPVDVDHLVVPRRVTSSWGAGSSIMVTWMENGLSQKQIRKILSIDAHHRDSELVVLHIDEAVSLPANWKEESSMAPVIELLSRSIMFVGMHSGGVQIRFLRTPSMPQRVAGVTFQNFGMPNDIDQETRSPIFFEDCIDLSGTVLTNNLFLNPNNADSCISFQDSMSALVENNVAHGSDAVCVMDDDGDNGNLFRFNINV